MPSQLDLNGILLLPTGSSITLHTASGDFDFSRVGLPNGEVKTQKGDDAISLSEKWLLAFTEKVEVPDDCISFVWSCDGTGTNRYQVLVIFMRLLADRWDELQDDEYSERCLVCCRFLDSIPRGIPREEKCDECYSPFLCNRCTVTLKGGGAKCYWCLTKEELVQLKEYYPLESLRLDLLCFPDDDD